ncbi:MAG: 3-dehydroquinate synthase [Gemmatimonadota bacterium]|nr:MAG: 3-dehydroquinate synthase [Gemmatimonadota bacterium]
MNAEPETDYLIAVALDRAPPVHSYNVRVRPGLLADAGAIIAGECAAERYLIVTDSQVGRLYADRLRETLAGGDRPVGVVQFAAGEWNKTRESWGELTDGMARARLGRETLVIALGGGVTCDLAGFLAATYAGGLALALVPTSLAAMLDAPLAGRASLHTEAGRNLIGLRHAPSLVLIDPLLLGTLPRPQYLAGLAPALKHGLIADSAYLQELETSLGAIMAREPSALAAVISRSLEIKAEVLRRDQTEAGYGQVLEFGERSARVQQAILGYSWLDGETLAVGLALEAALGEAVGMTRPGVAERVRATLREVGLPTELDGEIDDASFLEARERLARREASDYTLLADVGCVARSEQGAWVQEVGVEVVRSAIFGAS